MVYCYVSCLDLLFVVRCGLRFIAFVDVVFFVWRLWCCNCVTWCIWLMFGCLLWFSASVELFACSISICRLAFTTFCCGW